MRPTPTSPMFSSSMRSSVWSASCSWSSAVRTVPAPAGTGVASAAEGRSASTLGRACARSTYSTTTRAIRSAAWPSPKIGGRSAGSGRRSAAANASGSHPTSVFQPVSTVSTHSVSSRSVTQRTPHRYASRCTPPESVAIARAPRSSSSMRV